LSLDLNISHTPPPELIELLANTVYGSNEGTRYQHTGVSEKLARLNNPTFITIIKHNRLIGAVTFCQRNFETSGADIKGLYVRYFSFFEAFRSKTASKKPGRANGPIKQKVRAMMERGLDEQTNNKAVFYAYVELENERSRKICNDFGFSPVRKLSTLLFSRFFPKKRPDVFRVSEDEKPAVRQLLQGFYTNYNMYKSDRLFTNDNYFVIKDGEDIVAGVQATPVRWIIRAMPGLSGKIIMNILPLLPFLSRLFNPKKHRFLACDQVFYKKGYEHLLDGLFESVCAITGHYSAIFWADSRSPLYQGLSTHCKLGIMNKLKKDIPGDIVVNYNNIPKQEQEMFSQKPAYICSFDLT